MAGFFAIIRVMQSRPGRAGTHLLALPRGLWWAASDASAPAPGALASAPFAVVTKPSALKYRAENRAARYSGISLRHEITVAGTYSDLERSRYRRSR